MYFTEKKKDKEFDKGEIKKGRDSFLNGRHHKSPVIFSSFLSLYSFVIISNKERTARSSPTFIFLNHVIAQHVRT